MFSLMDSYSFVLKHIYLNVMKVFNISNIYFILDILENTDKQKGVFRLIRITINILAYVLPAFLLCMHILLEKK